MNVLFHRTLIIADVTDAQTMLLSFTS